MTAGGDEVTVPILVVDDRPENIVAIKSALKWPGLQIVTALSGAEALRAVLHHDFALILMDVLMPEMDGFEAAEMIHAREASGHVPIMFLTAAGNDPQLVSRGYALGAADYLVKPLDVSVMRAKISVFIELWRRDARHRQEAAQRASSAQALSQAARAHSEALFAATFRDARIGVGHLDVRGHWVRVNPKLAAFLEAPAEQLVGRPMTADLLQCVDGTPGALATPPPPWHGSGEWALRRETASPRRFEVTITPFGGGGQEPGCPEAWVCMVQDISERRRAAERQAAVLDISQALLQRRDVADLRATVARLAVPSMGDWCMVEQDGDAAQPPGYTLTHKRPEICERARAAYAELRQASPGRVGLRLGGETPRLFAGIEAFSSHMAASDEATRHLLDTLAQQSLIVVPLPCRSAPRGSLLLGYSRGGGAFDEADLVAAGDLGQRIALALDNAYLYAQSQQAVAVRDDFMSIASHELRTPLTPLLMQLQRMGGRRGTDGDALSAARVQGIASRSIQQVQRLAGLVDSLLDVSRIAAGKFTLNPERVDLADTVREVVERYTEKLAEAECELRMDIESPVCGLWDPLRVEQVVVNLLSNAVKYGGGKPIELAVRRRQGRAQLVVRDHGIGIPHNRLAHIFDRFERATGDRQFSGLGLGLYIVREILDAHGGSVQVDSEQDHGSRFTVWLPLAESTA